jgi:aminoglycoside phosphotransferase (APT) family kinase protein
MSLQWNSASTSQGAEPHIVGPYLAEHLGDAAWKDCTVGLISGGKSNLTYVVTDGTHRWVLRRPPMSGLTQSAHDVAREWRVTQALQYSAVPVPPAVALCEDPSVIGAPFAVTGFVSGQVVRTRAQLDAYTSRELESCVTELVRVLADLHSVDVAEVGLDGLGRPDGFLGRQVRLWWRQWNEVKSQDLADATRLHANLLTALPSGSGHIGVVHGDYRIDNALLDGSDITKVLAVVDWELATVGDVQTDIALMCVYRQPHLDSILGFDAAWASDRLPDADAIAEAYARRRGVDLNHWPFYLALANFKLAVIAQGISYRARRGAVAGTTAASAEQAVPALLAAGLRELPTS